MRAIRENRYVVGQADFEYAWDQIVTKRQQGPEDEWGDFYASNRRLKNRGED